MRRILLPFLCAAVLAASLPALAARPDTRARADDAALRAALQAIRARHGVPGMAAAVFDRERIRAFGVGELAPGGNPVTPESRFRAGQVSLLFAGIAVATLVTDGSLPEDGELRRLAPEIDLHNPWSGERTVQVGDLLAHRAGLGAVHYRDVYAEAHGKPLLAGINSAFRALRLEYRPGAQEQYSIVGPAIAAYLAEKAAGFPYDEVLTRLLFEPLETPATLGRAAGPLPGDAIGHAGWPAGTLPATPLNFPAAGDAWVSADGLARVGRLLLNRGRLAERDVLPPGAVDWLEAAPADSPALVPGARRGVHAEEFNGFLFYTQTGALPGFLARFAYSPNLGRGYVLLLNHGDARETFAAAEQLLRGQLLRGDVKPAPVAAPAALALPETMAGWYRSADSEAPPRRLFQPWTGIARLSRCDDAWCFRAPDGLRVLQGFDEERLREAGRWQPGWRLRMTDSGAVLENAANRWRQVPAWQVGAALLTAGIVIGGVLLAAMLLPYWSVTLLRRRLRDHRELLPRLLPLAAMLAVVAFQVALFTTGYPALGRASWQAITILVLSIMVPLLGALALAAAVAGFAWRLPRRTVLAGAYLALAAAVASGAMLASGLFAFQSWNY